MLKKFTLSLALCLSVAAVLPAQVPDTCSGPVTGTNLCSDACVSCVFNGYMGSTVGYPPNPAPGFCSAIENNQWLGFIAGANDATVTVDATNCQLGDGLQIAVYEQCGSAPIACNAGTAGGAGLPLNLALSMIPGKSYFLMIDGYAGDQCDFSVSVAPPSAVQSPGIGTPGALQGPAKICPDAGVTYSLPADVAGAGYYEWHTPPGWLINGQAGPLILPAPDGRTVSVVVGAQGGLVSVTPRNACATGTTVSLPVTVAPIAPTTLPPLTITTDDLPFFSWLFGDIYSSGVYFTALTSWQGCDSVVRQQIIVQPGGEASGTVFADLDGDGILNGADFPLQGIIVSGGASKFTATAANGRYYFPTLPVGDTIRAGVNLAGVTMTPPFYINQPGPESGLNFAVSGSNGPADIWVNLTNYINFRPGAKTGLALNVWNNSLVSHPGGQVRLFIPDNLDFILASPSPTGMDSDTLYWDFGALAPGQIFYVNIQVRTPVGTPLGTPVVLTAWGLPPNDAIPDNNLSVLTATVMGSYDPNDKQVTPAYITPAMLASRPPFEYTVRFQNTGNFPADVVRIIDTIQAGLDPASFRYIASSHPCRWEMRGAGIIEFIFDPIDLPDSVSNEPASHGFVKFSLRPKAGLTFGDVVENFADIYFDFNLPVRTNTTGTDVVYFIPGDPPAGTTMSARPNPASYKIIFAWSPPLPEAGLLRLFNLNGMLVAQQTVPAGSYSTDLYVADQPNGTYVALLEAGSQRYVKQVLIQRATGPIRRLERY